jgi:hypothetical protein
MCLLCTRTALLLSLEKLSPAGHLSAQGSQLLLLLPLPPLNLLLLSWSPSLPELLSVSASECYYRSSHTYACMHACRNPLSKHAWCTDSLETHKSSPVSPKSRPQGSGATEARMQHFQEHARKYIVQTHTSLHADIYIFNRMLLAQTSGSALTSLVSGIASGAVSKTAKELILHPIDTVRVCE